MNSSIVNYLIELIESLSVRSLKFSKNVMGLWHSTPDKVSRGMQ